MGEGAAQREFGACDYGIKISFEQAKSGTGKSEVLSAGN